MRRVVGYIDGRAIWSENVPAQPLHSRIGGELVVGGPGANDRDKANEHQRKSKARIRAAKE